VTEPVLTTRALNRALLDRQLLLERADLSIPDAVDQIGGLQTQYAPSGYVGLWTRVASFRRDDLTAALIDRSVVQGTLMRTTIHMVSRRGFWLHAMGVRQARRVWALRAARDSDETEWIARASRLRDALRGGPRNVKELGEAGAGFVGNLGLWVDIVRVPPSGTWERRRADILALAEDWVGPCGATEEEGLAHLVRAYLRAFGPSPWRDIASWAGIPVTEARRAGQAVDLVRYRDESGRELIDLSEGPLPDPETPAPARFLPHWDAALLVHARRTGLLPEAHRPRVFSDRNPFSVGTCLVDGRIVGAWTVRDGRIALDLFEELGRRDRDAVEEEREALEAFHA
jgi:hypothetical protein